MNLCELMIHISSCSLHVATIRGTSLFPLLASHIERCRIYGSTHMVASNPGFPFQILSHSLIPIFLKSYKTKSGMESLDSRIAVWDLYDKIVNSWWNINENLFLINLFIDHSHHTYVFEDGWDWVHLCSIIIHVKKVSKLSAFQSKIIIS